MVDVKVGKSYRNGYGSTVKITEAIDPNDPDNRLDIEAGYAFRDQHGRRYTATGDNNDAGLVLVSEANGVEVDKLNNGKYCITVDSKMIIRDQSADQVIRWLLRKVNQ